MTFLAAGWLVLLVPWAALVAWTWRRVADEHATTAAFLWTSETTEVPRARARRGRPPSWVMAALLSVLAAILALAGPGWRGRIARVAVVVDGSIALAARVDGRTLRDELVNRSGHELARGEEDIQIDMRIAGAPDAVERTRDEVHRAPFTAKPTDVAVTHAIEAGLRESDAVLVLTDQPVATRDDRVAVRVPTSKPDNVGIVFSIAVEGPRPSLMVKIANDSDRSEATLDVKTSESRGVPAPSSAPNLGPGTVRLSLRQTIALPARGESKNYFVDLSAPGEQIEIALVNMDDSLAVDNVATLMRATASPRLTVDAGAPEIATRFAAAYGSARSSSGGVRTIRIAHERDDAAGEECLIVFAALTREIPSGVVTTFDHPIHRDVDLDTPRRVAGPPASGWSPIAVVDGTPILAVRETPARSVWIGFDLVPNDASSVVLLANAVDWIAESNVAEWRGDVPASIGSDWRPIALIDPTLDGSPGTYIDGTGRVVAVNMPAVVGPYGEARGDIGELLRRADRATIIPLQKQIAITAGCLAFVAAVLVGRGSTRLSARRRVP